ILDAVHARTRPHVAADVLLPREQLAQVGVTFLALDLVRPELEDRTGTVQGLGHETAERLVVVAHPRGSSLSRSSVGGEPKGPSVITARCGTDRPLRLVDSRRIIEPTRETV